MPDQPPLDGSQLETFALAIGGLQIPKLPRISQISISGQRAAFDASDASIESEAPYEVRVELSEADLCAFVRSQLPDRLRLRDLRVTDAGIEFSADAVVIVSIPVRLLLRLAILNETEIHVVADNVNVLGAGPKQLIANQLQTLNPILKASDLPIGIRFTGITQQTAKLTIFGSLENKISTSKIMI
jgi:hypothetical protein